MATNRSFVPVSGPVTASPSTCGQYELVWRSYITRLELYSLPEVPKSRSLPSISGRTNAIPVLQRGQ